MKTVVTDERIPADSADKLRSLGFTVMLLPPYPALPDALASHTDMLIARLGNHIITQADYCDRSAYIFTDLLCLYPQLRVHFASDEVKKEYPHDAVMNVLSFADRLFCREDSVSGYIKSLAHALGYRTVNVKQGYPACTVLKLNEESAITADKGMARALRAEGIRVYEIKEGGIALPPYEYGFIGGACGVHGGVCYFAGDLSTHPDAQAIRTALASEGITPISLGRGRLTDVGGLFFFDTLDNDGR